jgi:hypothetical protein
MSWDKPINGKSIKNRTRYFFIYALIKLWFNDN